MPARPAAVLLLVLLGALLPAPAAAAPGSPAGQVGLWTAPLAGPLPVGRPFEAPSHAYGPGHRGVDLEALAGDVVRAAGDGVVAFAGMVAGRPVVSIDHAGGLRTTYEPVDPSVGAGQVVTRGSPIGVLSAGHAGCPGESCLHWGLRSGRTYLDPLALLRPPRIRLLPLHDPGAPSRWGHTVHRTTGRRDVGQEPRGARPTMRSASVPLSAPRRPPGAALLRACRMVRGRID